MNNHRPLIEVTNLNLSFGKFHALKNVSVSFNAGELVGLVGDNGAGKTTLIGVLSGLHAPSSGEVYFDGQKINHFHPHLAMELGIETIQQSVGLCDNLSIARNIFLGREPVKRVLGLKLLDFAHMRKTSQRIIREFGLRDSVNVDDEVESLSGGERQSIKLGRAIEFKNRVVIMDEPTNHLSVREREHVNKLALQLRDQGLLVIYITHDIFQIHKLADRIILMELGEVVTDTSTATKSALELEATIRGVGHFGIKEITV